MTKEELLKLKPGTLVDVTVDGEYWGYSSIINVVDLSTDESTDELAMAYVVGWGRGFSPNQISLHTPQPQVSGTIETPPKLYTFAYGNATPATDDQIMAQPCVKESRNTVDALNDVIAKRNETIHTLRAHVMQLRTPPTTDEVKHAYNTLIVAGYKDEARVLQTLSHVVERLSEQIKEDECSSNK